jgi:hypothetical protein
VVKVTEGIPQDEIVTEPVIMTNKIIMMAMITMDSVIDVVIIMIMTATECRGRAVSNPASCLGGVGLCLCQVDQQF